MQKRSFLPIFLLFLFLCGIVIVISRTGFLQGMQFLDTPLFAIEGGIFHIRQVSFSWSDNKKLETLQNDNRMLYKEVTDLQKVQQDNVALRDQFETSNISSSKLLPAQVIGDPQFIPGISAPESLVIDKGSSDEVENGDTVVYQANLVGWVSQVSRHAALVTLTSNKASSFIAKTSSTHAQGVLTGQGSGVMVLGNVVLSDMVKVGDSVVTNGSQDSAGHGFPPGLLVGKIISVNKNPSSLYQSASVQSLLDIAKLTTVFIMK